MIDLRALDGKTALVTGASGFIGSALSRRLQQHGVTVHGISRQPPERHRQDIRWWQSNLLSLDDVRKIARAVQPDFIFDLASYVVGSRSVELVLPTMQANLLSAVNLLIAATESGCRRIVLSGSMEEPQPEKCWVVPCSPYAAAKFAASTYGRMFHSLYKIPVATLRLFMVYGPGQQDLKKLIPYVILSLLEGRAPELSSGVRRVDWIYIDDIVDGYLAAAVAKGAEGSTIDLGSGELISVRGIVERLVEMVDPAGAKPRFGAIPDRPMEQESRADLTNARALLGWQPQTTLDIGLQRTVDWYRAWYNAGGIVQTLPS
jgi:nucleoside-diphosphate-sugar epimerase